MEIKGALHLHSAYSYDAKLSLAELRDLFLEEGLSFALMTEHTDEMRKEEGERFIAECRKRSDEKFLFIPGFEVPYKDTHTLMLGVDIFSDESETMALKTFRKNASLAVLAHPHKHGFWVDDTLFSVIDGLEIWNSQYDGKYVPRKQSLELFHALKKEKPLLAFSGWDFHRSEHAGGPTLHLNVSALTQKNVLTTLQAGEFTLHGRGSALNAKGQFLKGGGTILRICGTLSVLLVTLGKKVNALLASVGLRPPRTLRRFIRRFL